MYSLRKFLADQELNDMPLGLRHDEQFDLSICTDDQKATYAQMKMLEAFTNDFAFLVSEYISAFDGYSISFPDCFRKTAKEQLNLFNNLGE